VGYILLVSLFIVLILSRDSVIH